MSEVRSRSRHKGSTQTSSIDEDDGAKNKLNVKKKDSKGSWRGALDWTAMLLVLVYGTYLAYYFGTRVLPDVKSAEVAGLTGFSEERAFNHVKALTRFGPHPVGSDALEQALEYVLSEVRLAESAAGPGVDVEISQFVASGYNRLEGGLFYGRTLAYSNLKSIVVRVSPKYSAESAEENALLVSSHIDTVVTSSGAGDCSSCVAVMLELLRGLSHRAHKFRHSVVFLFNTGEEEGLDGAHSFITQHPWSNSVRAFIDLESMGVGGKSVLFQAPDQWLLETFTKVAPHPALQIMAQDVFHSGIVKSATDFQVYREVAGFSGLDFAHMENGAVYHTKNDKLQLLRRGSLQHSGDNVLAFLAEVATSEDFVTAPKHNATELQRFDSKMTMVYFDILGKYAVTYSRDFARVLNTSVIMQVLLILSRSVYPAGLSAVISLALGLFTLLLTWASSIISVVIVSLLTPRLSSYTIPYIASPWLAIGLFGSPALMGALIGNWLGHNILVKYLTKSRQGQSSGPPIEWEAERWLYKAGFLQWIIVLALGNWAGAGSSYLAVSWVVCPAAAYGLLNYHSPGRQPQTQLSLLSFWVGVIPPTILSANAFVMLPRFLISNLVRFDRNPGGSPDWLGHMLVAGLISTIICLGFVYLLPFAHRRGGIKWILGGCLLITVGAALLVFYQIFPPFTENLGRAVNVVHIIETTEGHTKSYISLAAHTPGKFDQELKRLGDFGFVCGKGGPDLVSYSIKFGCTKSLELDPSLWKERPSLLVESDRQLDGGRTTSVTFRAASAHRWFAAINTDKIAALSIESTDADQKSLGVYVPPDKIIGEGGWHYVQFVTDKYGPHNFLLKLVWGNVSSTEDDLGVDLIKVRTDVNIVTREVATVLERIPECSIFGKSTSPYTLAYLDKLTLRSLR